MTAVLRHPAFAFVTLVLVWGSTWIVIKDQVGAVPPAWTIVWRFVLAGAGMIWLARVRGESLRLPAPAHGVAIAVGLLQFSCNFHFVYRAESYLTSGIVAILYALMLVPNAILGWVLLRQPVTRRFLAGSTVAIAGIALLLLNEVRSGADSTTGLGVGLAVAGLIAASIASVIQAVPAARAPAVPLLAHAMLWGTAANIVLAVIMDGAPTFDLRPQYWAGLFWLALVGSVLAFPLYFALIRRIGPGPAAYSNVAIPVVAMVLSTWFEGYRWTVLAVAGSALALAGLALALSGGRRGQAS